MSKGSCGFCGEHFDNVFEAVDHVEPDFDPAFIVSKNHKLMLGTLFYKVYQHLDCDKSKKMIEDEFALLYIAEKRPEELSITYAAFSQGDYSVTKRVYDIVGEDSWKKLSQ